MSKIEFRGRPVAALATETRFHRDVAPGETIELGVEIEACDDDAVAYSGWAKVDGAQAVELIHCLGPMLLVEDFDAPDEMRRHFALLRGRGSPEGRFPGVETPPADVIEHESGHFARARLHVPKHARFFADHFPRNPVFPATLLLDAQIRLAALLAREVFAGSVEPVPMRMTHVKMRSFITPGQVVEIRAALAQERAEPLRISLSASSEGKTVATARVEFASRRQA
jgi:3-hydroxymyristoyl/3-hydroxydecanoyl-(acyl carrier protein) dehydratase